jgi:hypothetical protein
MNENVRKAFLYFQPTFTYWKQADIGTAYLPSRNGFYPLSIAPRIKQGHYPFFDGHGIPKFHNRLGILVHHYTTICSYALGNWELYLQTGIQLYADRVIAISKYLSESFIDANGKALFVDFEDENETIGKPCAMNQGEAISVLIRGHELTNDKKYLQIASAASKAFEAEYNFDGVAKALPQTDRVWYLEGGRYILNGHIYALWGLWEINNYEQSVIAQDLYDAGLSSLEHALPFFDNGYWSLYWLHKPDYVSSMMYHNLHVVQLSHLSQISKSEILKKYASLFELYSYNPINRLKSAARLMKAKLQ